MCDGSPGFLTTPPPRSTAYPVSGSSSSAMTPQALPFNTGSSRDPLLTEEQKKDLAKNMEKAKEKLKDDKAAAKKAVASLRGNMSKPAKSSEAKSSAADSRGRGRGKGRGRGRGRKATAEPETEGELEEEIDAVDSEMEKEIETLQEVDVDLVESPPSEHDSILTADTLELGDEPPETVPKRKRERSSGPVAKKPSTRATSSKKDEAMKGKMKVNQKQKKGTEIKAKAAAPEKKKSKAAKKKEKKDGDASKGSFDGNSNKEMHQFIKAESIRFKAEGMSPKEALAAARKACLGFE